jgi:hypothetical protein
MFGNGRKDCAVPLVRVSVQSARQQISIIPRLGEVVDLTKAFSVGGALPLTPSAEL